MSEMGHAGCQWCVDLVAWSGLGWAEWGGVVRWGLVGVEWLTCGKGQVRRVGLAAMARQGRIVWVGRDGEDIVRPIPLIETMMSSLSTPPICARLPGPTPATYR